MATIYQPTDLGGPMDVLPTITPADRFAADRFASTLAYEGPRNLRVTIETAAKVESFPGSYNLDEVATAEALILAAADADAGKLTRGQVERIAGRFLAAHDATK